LSWIEKQTQSRNGAGSGTRPKSFVKSFRKKFFDFYFCKTSILHAPAWKMLFMVTNTRLSVLRLDIRNEYRFNLLRSVSFNDELIKMRSISMLNVQLFLKVTPVSFLCTET
jgi:hypothetical protein